MLSLENIYTLYFRSYILTIFIYQPIHNNNNNINTNIIFGNSLLTVKNKWYNIDYKMV